MEKTWRWFGKKDKITLAMLKQIGVEGIVTALHDIPLGQVWTREAIHDLKSYIEQHGMRWSVVESLPVTETIKYGGHDRNQQIEVYKQSLRNLSAEGIHTICYNFMPVLDWARTDLEHPNPNGTTSLYFSWAQFSYFDIHILKRDGASDDWRKRGEEMHRDILGEVAKLKKSMTAADDKRLVENIIVKTQGFVSGNIQEDEARPVDLFRQLLAHYKGIDKEQLRKNLRDFLNAIMPVCDECDLYMCVHPDDPPFPILGLPRIINCDEDIQWLMETVPNPRNGLTFCAGSLSAGAHNDITALAHKYAERTWFVHMRSCHIFPNGDFTEASHLGGRADLIELTKIFEQEEMKRKDNPTTRLLPMRVDHGMTMLGDEKQAYNAGYSFLGRMFAMGQVQGVMATVDKELGKINSQQDFYK